MEEKEEQGDILPVPYFITVTPIINVNHPSYKDILWINYIYNNYTFNWYYRPKALYNHFPSIQKRDYTIIKVKLKPVYY